MQITPPPGILLVDDYPDGLEVWSLYLRMCGFQVFTAADGEEALQVAHDLKPAIVILDLELPKISGVEAARQLRAADDTMAIPLIAVTGHSEPGRLEEARLAGFDLILVKPCDPDRLRQEIQRLLSPSASSADIPHATTNRQWRSQSD